MIKRREVANVNYMEGLDVSIGNNAVTISPGMIQNKDNPSYFEKTTFNLEPDESLPVLYDLYILTDENTFFFSLEKTYLDDEFPPSYTGEYKLFHMFISIEVKPDGSKEGHVTRIVKPKPAKRHKRDLQEKDD
ncbi:hypothetical protein SAMN05421676_1123 [Salinibacillus kushneri]|uniref:Uncharacterized protein n=1 Tax=Salinibacillus kushneri TaxID=237682 RepID=A0A1I0ICZ4_9BACI|nr:hypothetical protein [Salinibacillus kushneri]SET94589.1 hypothetical protein SAMN05421676_1123 [Salinibacillus kushneri]